MSNPKDLVGAKKAPLGLVPPALEIGAAEAMADGAAKYGPFNWRETPVEYMTYLVAMKRHIDALIDGEDFASDSGYHHLHHIAAGAGILIDANNIPGCLVDNRPPKGPAARMLQAQDKSAKKDEGPIWQIKSDDKLTTEQQLKMIDAYRKWAASPASRNIVAGPPPGITIEKIEALDPTSDTFEEEVEDLIKAKIESIVRGPVDRDEWPTSEELYPQHDMTNAGWGETIDCNPGCKPSHTTIPLRTVAQCGCPGQDFGGHDIDCPRREAKPFA